MTLSMLLLAMAAEGRALSINPCILGTSRLRQARDSFAAVLISIAEAARPPPAIDAWAAELISRTPGEDFEVHLARGLRSHQGQSALVGC